VVVEFIRYVIILFFHDGERKRTASTKKKIKHTQTQPQVTNKKHTAPPIVFDTLP
jgi:hypothetical protein